MKSVIIFLTILFYCANGACFSQTYTPSEVTTGINPNTGYSLKKDEEERFKRVFGNMQKPEKYKIPKFSTEQLSTSSEEKANVQSKRESVNYYPPTNNQSASSYQQNGNKPVAETKPNTVGETHTVPYDKSMDEFINGALGYDPNLTLEQNREIYHRNGYNISYKVKDSTIYTISGLTILLILLVIFYKTKRADYQEKYKTAN